MRFVLVAAAIALAGVPAASADSIPTPAENAANLIAADRSFAEASAKTDSVSGITAMFAPDVAMPLPDATFSRNKAEAVEALGTNPLNRTSRAEWTPVRVGVSADGTQGFTTGYMILHDKDAPARRAKYLAYWIKRPEGWRVTSYKRSPQGTTDFPAELLPPVLPSKAVMPSEDSKLLAAHRRDIDAAERGFSNEAQAIGLGPAFCKHGASDATNLGTPSDAIIRGVEKICAAVGGPPPSPVRWAPDAVIVASSGDMGITWGMIRLNGPAVEGRPAAFPYSTVWVRAGPDAPWKYIAE